MLDYPPNGSYRLREDLATDCNLLEQSDLFDQAWYRARAGLDADSNGAEHYLLTGWQLGIEPGPNFEGSFLYPYFFSVGLKDPPAITYLNLRAAGMPVYANRASAEALAAQIRGTEWFDGYAARAGCGDLDPALHYLMVGEQVGYPPSDQFDPVYYRLRNPDVQQARLSLLGHFVTCGRAEGRRPVSIASQLAFDTSRLNPERQTILLVLHQASRTGAPILAYNIAGRLSERYNVVALLLAGGELIQDFQRCCAATIGPLSCDEVEADYLVKRLVATYSISYAIANTIDTRIMLKPLACALVPVVALVHEFASYLAPKGEMGRALDWATQIVFSAKSVASSAIAEYPNLEDRVIHILPQGQSKLPPAPTMQVRREQEEALRRAIRPPGAENAIIVLGCGTIFLRKGVDLFFSCAASVAALAPKRPVRFLWVGSPVPTWVHRDYFTLISEQIVRSGLEDMAAIVDEVVDLEPAYAAAELFLLSSRLDPLPNVAIEAALRGIPVVCFDNAGGMADLLRANPATRMSVMPYLDVHAAACLIAKLADDPTARKRLGKATRRLARATFDMEGYVQRIDDLGREAIKIMDQRAKDFATINADPMFDTTNFLGPDALASDREEAIRLFLARAAALGTGQRPLVNFYYRRPCPGFHPQIYASENAHRYDSVNINPLAHFIRNGKPDGAWRHDFITPSDFDESGVRESKQRVALHAHFYYPELIDDFLTKLASNRSRCDLLLSTNDSIKTQMLREATARYAGGSVVIRIVPNRGRDIGPFLTAFAKEIAEGYDFIGHVHGKRSLTSTDAALGESWREFLWQNMIGGLCPMIELILQRFASDPGLGMIFPDDPHLSDWDSNREIARPLAERMGITAPLPLFFNFPIGTMFWARPEALTPLFALGLDWDDYPEEPLPIDGTMLHAMERLLPFAARQAGYRYATTHIPGLTW